MPNTLDDIELRSEEVQEILTKVPNWMIRWGSLLFLTLIILLLFLSWLIKYPDVIASQAVITTTVPPQKEYANATGKMDSIYVSDNQEVFKGQVLAIIENSAIAEDVLYLKSILDTVSVNKEAFYFPTEKLPILFLGDIDPYFADFENSYNAYVLNRELKPFSNQAQANNISLDELETRLANIKEQQRLTKSELELKRKDLGRNKLLYEKGVISSQEYENKQLDFINSERNYKNMGVSISQLKSDIALARKTSKETQISKSKKELQLLKNTIQSYSSLKKAVKDWGNTYVLISEINGKVSFLNFWSNNQTVFTGDQVFTIIPTKDSQYMAKLTTPSQNSGKIEIGQKVNIMLANYPETEFGVLKGAVKHVSHTLDKDGNYIIDVTLPKKLITSYGKELQFKQEMLGQAEIITEDLRLIERFFYQFRVIL
ncbi:HlyD family efflux transporter periplasmic adaptor subunit [Galbibacter sp. EGI 63066]|uniref:HlyD family efflux transporter periplasmic adaptor subunit n=1 Tax=Galbibacter sp. EGI 63066 TaxID=2993559 RepID=UPI002248FB56|nr:HlyD family efflux transporter periplasmic adaptor subunit [Galbibacter sp. EGI 63066]MCX2681952.1 HlyD family efflux transporter periplasmic adaptor subunit [Galbibacter sp. EGI 63066]